MYLIRYHSYKCNNMDKLYTRQKRNAPRRTDQLSERSQMMDKFRVYRCKGMSGTAALHIFCDKVSKCVKIGHKPSGRQIVRSKKISVYNAPLLD